MHFFQFLSIMMDQNQPKTTLTISKKHLHCYFSLKIPPKKDQFSDNTHACSTSYINTNLTFIHTSKFLTIIKRNILPLSPSLVG